MSKFHELTTYRTGEQVESCGTELIFRSMPDEASIHDGVTVTSSDGYVFIGHVSDVDNHGTDECQMSAHIHVTLS